MKKVRITAAGYDFIARAEDRGAPGTWKEFHKLMPYRARLIHARWSGEACWIPLGDFTLNVGFENPTSHPAPGEILFHPGGVSETEILLPYGPTCFSSKVGQLAGNNFLTIIEGLEHLTDLGRMVLWEGAQNILFEEL